MANDIQTLDELRQQERLRTSIQQRLSQHSAEDDGLRNAIVRGEEQGARDSELHPAGKMLQCSPRSARRRKFWRSAHWADSVSGWHVLWPASGRLITLEISPKHAEAVRTFCQSRCPDRGEVRVGKALDLLPKLESEAPFDLVFIDADKVSYPDYLTWAIRLSRPGSIIVATTVSAADRLFRHPLNADTEALLNKQACSQRSPACFADFAMDDIY